jgi:hypothetical protein
MLNRGSNTFLVGQNGSIYFGAEVFLLCNLRLVTTVDWTCIYKSLHVSNHRHYSRVRRCEVWPIRYLTDLATLRSFYSCSLPLRDSTWGLVMYLHHRLCHEDRADLLRLQVHLGCEGVQRSEERVQGTVQEGI